MPLLVVSKNATIYEKLRREIIFLHLTVAQRKGGKNVLFGFFSPEIVSDCSIWQKAVKMHIFLITFSIS
jgi:hypothetical protein